jgi:hypothetical protein
MRRNASMITRVAVAAVPMLALLLVGCGTSEPPVVDWRDVQETTTCEALNPASCVGAAGFTVSVDGSWTAGPSASGDIRRGNVTSEERARLATDVLQISVGAAQVCDAAGNVPGISDVVDLTLAQSGPVRVFAKGTVPNQTCYRGGREAAVRLHDDLNALMLRYYPQPFA